MAAAATAKKGERRGPVLKMLRELLDAGQKEEVVALVKQLVARNEELERKLGGKMKANEGVSSAQLLHWAGSAARRASSSSGK